MLVCDNVRVTRVRMTVLKGETVVEQVEVTGDALSMLQAMTTFKSKGRAISDMAFPEEAMSNPRE